MEQAKQGDTVKVHYTGKLTDGSVFDSTQGRKPLEFKIGDGKIIPGFEKAVLGMIPGESKDEQVAAEEAYGPHRDDLILQVDRKDIPTDINIEVGLHLQVSQPQGPTVPVTVTDVSESNVTLDANHPLAGKDLVFQIELVEIVAA